MPKAEVVSPKANPPRATPKREAAEPTRPAATPKRCVPKSGSREPEGQPLGGHLRNGRRKNQPSERPPSKRKAISEAERRPERRKSPKASDRHPQVEAAKRGVGGAVPTHLPIQSKNAIVTPRGPSSHHKKCFTIRNQALPRVGKKQKKSRKSLSQLGNKSRKAPNSAPNGQKASKSCEFSPSTPLVGTRGGSSGSSESTLATATSPHTGARESNSPPPVRRFGTKRRFRLPVSAKMPTFAAAIPPQSAARQGSPVVFAAAEALFTTFLKH